jgi:hypothetical protein
MGLGAAQHFAVINPGAGNLWAPDDATLLPFCVTVHSCTMRRCPHAPREREGARDTLLRGASGCGLISTSVTTGLDRRGLGPVSLKMDPPDVSNRSYPDDWEYEYDQPEDQPRTPQEPSLDPSAPENYPQEKHYTTEPADPSNVELITEKFAGASISPGGGTYSSGTYTGAASSGAYPGASNTGFFPAATGPAYPGVAGAGYATGPAYGQSSYAAPTTGWQKQVHIQTRDPYTDREAFDPRKYIASIPVLSDASQTIKYMELGHLNSERQESLLDLSFRCSNCNQIFKVLWAEPKGEGAGSAGQSGTESLTVRKGPGGKDTFAKVRRFVIIKPMDGHCICLSVTKQVTLSPHSANHLPDQS